MRSLRWVIKAPDWLGDSHHHLLRCYWKESNRTTDARKREVLLFVVVAYVVDPTHDLGIAWIYFWSPTRFLLNILQQFHTSVQETGLTQLKTKMSDRLYLTFVAVYSFCLFLTRAQGWLEPLPIPGIYKLYTELSLRSNAFVVGRRQEPNHPTPDFFFINKTILYYQHS